MNWNEASVDAAVLVFPNQDSGDDLLLEYELPVYTYQKLQEIGDLFGQNIEGVMLVAANLGELILGGKSGSEPNRTTLLDDLMERLTGAKELQHHITKANANMLSVVAGMDIIYTELQLKYPKIPRHEVLHSEYVGQQKIDFKNEELPMSAESIINNTQQITHLLPVDTYRWVRECAITRQMHPQLVLTTVSQVFIYLFFITECPEYMETGSLRGDIMGKYYALQRGIAHFQSVIRRSHQLQIGITQLLKVYPNAWVRVLEYQKEKQKGQLQ